MNVNWKYCYNPRQFGKTTAFADWLTKQHAAQISAASAALLCGKSVRIVYDRELQRVTCTPVEARER